jgi:hypothetical protein
MYEPSREPVETSRSEMEHRRSGKGKRIKGKTCTSFSSFVNRARLICDARRKITRC